MSRYTIGAGGALTGKIRVPGDKSISHRALMFAGIAQGQSNIEGLLAGEDTLATLAAMRALGVQIDRHGETAVSVRGVGMQGLKSPEAPLDLGNSGTSMRLFSGLLSGAGLHAVLVGDASLMTRPMRRVTDPLSMMGASILTSKDGTAPIEIAADNTLTGIEYEMPIASAQVKSAILLAGLYARGETRLREPAPSRDHTERMLRQFGVEIQSDGPCISLRGGQRLVASDVAVPCDLSSAAFFIVGACLAPGSRLLLERVGMNPTRTGVVDILTRMGADIEIRNQGRCGDEPVADLLVRHAPLKGIEIPPALVPLAIDEFPAILVAAANAEGETILSGARELRYKESDRIAAVADALQALGVSVSTSPDGMRVRGGPIAGGEVASRGDHRIAMAFAMAGLVADGDVHILDCDNVATSFPGFADLAGRAGLKIEVQDS